MSRRRKWIIGILIGLVVVAIAATASFVVLTRRGELGWAKQARSEQNWEQKGSQQWEGKDIHPWSQIPHRAMPASPCYGMQYRNFGGFFPLGLIFGSLFYLGLLTLMVLGVIVLIRYLRHPTRPEKLGGAAVSPTPALASDIEASQESGRTCPNCSHLVREDWSHCPYCGVLL